MFSRLTASFFPFLHPGTLNLFPAHRQLLSVLIVPSNDHLHLILGKRGKGGIGAEGGDDGLRAKGAEEGGGEWSSFWRERRLVRAEGQPRLDRCFVFARRRAVRGDTMSVWQMRVRMSPRRFGDNLVATGARGFRRCGEPPAPAPARELGGAPRPQRCGQQGHAVRTFDVVSSPFCRSCWESGGAAVAVAEGASSIDMA